MCGIAGELRFSDTQGERADWEKISSMMARRGPDDEGIWAKDGYCTLVFRRLAIIDLSFRGHQPMVAGSGRYVLVFNGEVYNFMALRKQLTSLGVQFCSESDSEVVLYSLIEWGKAALSRFNGMFSIAFYDSVEKTILLARDHAGMKPLYYLICPKGIVFASQYDQLLKHPWSSDLDVSHEALGLYLRLAYIPAPYALLKETHMLEPGTCMEVNVNGYVDKGSFFTFPCFETPLLKGKEAVEAVDEALTAAVKRHLISDVPVGAFLSGGIDSPLVVAKMRSVSANGICVFTIGTGEKETDEVEDATRYASEIGVEHIIDHITPDEALDMMDNVIKACGEPFGDYSIFPTMLVSRLASRDFKVVLSGDGGDELFWGYPGRFVTLLKLAKIFREPLWWRKTRWKINNALNMGNRSRFLNMHSLGDCHRSMHTHLPEVFLGKIFPYLPAWPLDYEAFAYKDRELDRVAQWARWNEFVYHLTMVLMKVDRASMYHSLEVRVPLLDREVIEAAVKIDWRDCLDLDKMIGKLPLRRTLARYVRYQTQAKRGFEVPMGLWLRTSLRGIFERMVLKRDDILGLRIDRQALNKVFEEHVSGRHNYAWGLWPLLSLSLWVDRHYH
jgi:asparagine synthase (glutamine-hydrolysing)